MSSFFVIPSLLKTFEISDVLSNFKCDSAYRCLVDMEFVRYAISLCWLAESAFIVCSKVKYIGPLEKDFEVRLMFDTKPAFLLDYLSKFS